MTTLSFRYVEGFQVLDWKEGKDPTAEMTKAVRERVKEGHDVYRKWYDDHYCVSTAGSVYTRSQLTGMKWRPLKLTGTKYISISLTLPKNLRPDPEQSSSDSWLVHRLVMKTFEGDPPSAEQNAVRHLDGNPRNNKLINLAYGTRKQNMADIHDYKHVTVEVIPEIVATPKTLYTLQVSAVRDSLRAHIKLGYTLTQFAKSLDITTDVARNVLCGDFYARLRKSIEPDQNKFELCLGREGERHHKAKFTETDLTVALDNYVRNHWSGVQFAEALGIKQITAHAILSGDHWKHVPRPAGFTYPWPDAKSMNAMKGANHPLAEHTEQEMKDLFDRVVSGDFVSVKDMIQKTGMSRSMIYGILRQSAWPSLERPAGFAEAASKLYTRKLKDSEAQ